MGLSAQEAMSQAKMKAVADAKAEQKRLRLR